MQSSGPRNLLFRRYYVHSLNCVDEPAARGCERIGFNDGLLCGPYHLIEFCFRKPRGLTHAEAFINRLPQSVEPQHIGIRIKPSSTIAARGTHRAVSPFPNPNDIYGQAGELSHPSDEVLGRDGDHIIAGHTQASCCDVMIPSRSYSNGCEYVFCAKLRHKSRNLEADYEGTRNRCAWLGRWRAF